MKKRQGFQECLLASFVLILSACVVEPRAHVGLEVVPILPEVVVLGSDSYYAHGGYHYFYTNHGWYYSTRRDGPRMELPRSHWPRETRFR